MVFSIKTIFSGTSFDIKTLRQKKIKTHLLRGLKITFTLGSTTSPIKLYQSNILILYGY
jgi:hypothetical protein